MLIGFLIRHEEDWAEWKGAILSAPGKAIIHIADKEPVALGISGERDEAIDDVESFDGDEY